jgi:signal transduction histidine kinase
MNVEKNRRHAMLSWLFVVVLVVLCAALGIIQYRWIGEVSRAEHERLRASLQADLQQIGADFDDAIRSTCAALSPEFPSPDETENESESAIRYAKWRASGRYSGLLRRLAIAFQEDDSLVLRSLNPAKGIFEPTAWPAKWAGLRDSLTARASGDPAMRMRSFRAATPDELTLIELPQFRGPERGPDHHWPEHPAEPGFDRGPGRAPKPDMPRGGPERRAESGWTIVELDSDYIRDYLLPDILERHLGGGDNPEYYVEVVAKNHPSTVIYDSDPRHSSQATLHPDASIGLFEAPYDRFRPGDPQFGPPRRGAGPGPGVNRGRWLLSVRHRTGSLEALVEQTRRRNLAVTAAILLLMLAAVGALVQFSRRAQRLAELQMEFVAGISHELRTPLSVIRTAAHNLGVRVISNANQVQRYGSLIKEESEKLTDIVDRVLLFSNAKAGRVIASREVISVESVIEDALGACAKVVGESGCSVETIVEPGLPPVFGDPTALKHALLNLITNAAKYGSQGRWIGIFAAESVEKKTASVEIRVADHGPGIAPGDIDHIFDPFYRGKMAVEDQVHGTGLGLSLVQRIVKAHGGTVTVKSEPGKGTEFVMRIPAAPMEKMDEFADSANRR